MTPGDSLPRVLSKYCLNIVMPSYAEIHNHSLYRTYKNCCTDFVRKTKIQAINANKSLLEHQWRVLFLIFLRLLLTYSLCGSNLFISHWLPTVSPTSYNFISEGSVEETLEEGRLSGLRKLTVNMMVVVILSCFHVILSLKCSGRCREQSDKSQEK